MQSMLGIIGFVTLYIRNSDFRAISVVNDFQYTCAADRMLMAICLGAGSGTVVGKADLPRNWSAAIMA